MARATGIGGVFFRSEGDGATLAAWYREHLAMPLEVYGGAIDRWPDDKAADGGVTAWPWIMHQGEDTVELREPVGGGEQAREVTP